LISFTVEREGVEVNVLISPSFDMCKEEGKGVDFLQVLGFLENGRLLMRLKSRNSGSFWTTE
jgi:hypothetical protein